MDLIDLHQNTEWPARLDQVLSSNPVDWADRRQSVQSAAPPGLAPGRRAFAGEGTAHGRIRYGNCAGFGVPVGFGGRKPGGVDDPVSHRLGGDCDAVSFFVLGSPGR